MGVISKTWISIADTAVDPDSPIDATLMTGIRDDLVNLREWLGFSYSAGAVQDHNHDGVNSSATEIGPNLLRNGSFESSTSGWTQTNYVGGTQALDTVHYTHGIQCLAITLTNTTNGGGDAKSGFILCSPKESLLVYAIIYASVINVASKITVYWYDNTQSQISSTDLFVNTSTPTTATRYASAILPPSNAAYCKIDLIGGTPAAGSAVGSVYFDGCGISVLMRSGDYQVFTTSGTWTKPAWCTGNEQVLVEEWGGGGGATTSSGGAGGGGAYASRIFSASDLASTVTVTVGAGGAANGGTGGTSSFGSFISAYGGGGGSNGAGQGGGGGGELGAGINTGIGGLGFTTEDTGGAGGLNAAGLSAGSGGGGGGGGAASNVGGKSKLGGGGGGSNGGLGGTSYSGGAGGGSNTTGSTPGGGAGSGVSSVAGARGEVRVRVIP